MRVILNKAFWRAANRRSNNFNSSVIKIKHLSLTKRNFSLVYFCYYLFETIYKTIAEICLLSTQLLRLFSGDVPAMFITLPMFVRSSIHARFCRVFAWPMF